jgi:predicted RNase H-like HicB family nuclease
MKYAYPARFIHEEDGRYTVAFIDMELSTFGDDLADAAYMAQDALEGWLDVGLQYGDEIPQPSDPASLKAEGPNEFISLVSADIDPAAVATGAKPVEKTLSIPRWLDERARGQNVNLDAVFREALMEKVAQA